MWKELNLQDARADVERVQKKVDQMMQDARREVCRSLVMLQR